MRILDRLVTGTFIRLFVVSILATPPLFILGDLTENLDTYVDLGLPGTQVAYGYLFRLPEFIVWAFPIAALIAAVFTIYNMTAHHEIVAAKAGGVSFHRLITPILLAGLLLTGAGLSLTELAPRSNRIAFAILGAEDSRREWRSDFVFQTEDGTTVAARRLTVSDGRLANVVVQRRGDEERPSLHLEAQNALHGEEGWTFNDGFLRMIDAEGSLNAFEFQSMRLAGLDERPEDLLDTPPEVEEMTYAEIGRLAQIIERSGGNPNELRVKQEQKRAIPVATFVIILFGAPLATSSKRGGAAYGIGVALGTTILYLLMLKIAGGFGASGAIPPFFAAWTPNAVFFLTGAALLSRVRT